MKRDVNKMLAEYGKLEDKPRNNFFATDYYNVREQAIAQGGGAFNMIDVALRVGFMVGYRAGKKEKG